MRTAAAVLVASAVALGAAPARAVVGGTPVPEGEMRAVANVRISGVFGCTGTLIAPRWVMTAGHCGSLTSIATSGLVPSTPSYPPSEYTVVLDSVHADGRGGDEHRVTRVVVADEYGIQSGAGNDVSLLQLAKASTVPPLKIAAVGERRAWRPGVLATVAGFGATEENGRGADRMQQVDVPIRTDAECAEAYRNGLGGSEYDPKTMLCAGHPEGGRDTCQGDSGGPLLVPVDGGVRLAGATSFGYGCGRPEYPGVYARVAEGPLRTFVQRVVPAAFAAEPTARGGSAGSTGGSAGSTGAGTGDSGDRQAKKKKRSLARRCAKARRKAARPNATREQRARARRCTKRLKKQRQRSRQQRRA